MSAPASPDPARVALDRTKQVFKFLKAFAERNTPAARLLDDQPWVLRFADLPSHPSIVVGTIDGATSQTALPIEPEPESSNPALLIVRRPELGEPPKFRSAEAHAEWEAAEEPARLAAKIFDRLYELRGRIELESERVELMLGNGRIRCVRDGGVIDHPVLLQRVELLFDPKVPEFRLIDSDRSPELFTAILHGAEGSPARRFRSCRRNWRPGRFIRWLAKARRVFCAGCRCCSAGMAGGPTRCRPRRRRQLL